MAERPERGGRPERPDRAERPARVRVDRKAEKLQRADDRHRHRHPVQNPMDSVEPVGNVETDSDAYHAAFKNSLSERRKAEAERMHLATDSEYYVVVCFQSRAQKEHFLNATGWNGYSDKYLDGYYVADKLGIELPEVNITYNVSQKVDPKLAELVRTPLPDPTD